MSATQELIAAALSAADELDVEGWPLLKQMAIDLREACARAMVQPDEWQPIETAPKYGSMFLCWVSAVRYGETDEGRPFEHDTSQIDFCWWRPEFDGVPNTGYFDNAAGQVGDSQAVTHWMPLPEAPK